MDQTVSLLARAVSNKAKTLVGYEKLLARLPDEKLKGALTGIIENEQRHLEMLSSILSTLADEKAESGQSTKPGTKKTSPKGNDLKLVQKLLQSAMKSAQGRQVGVVKAATKPAVPGDKWALQPTDEEPKPETEPKTESESEPEKGLVETLKDGLIRDEYPPKVEDAPTATDPVPDDEPVVTEVAAAGDHEADDAPSVSETEPVSDGEPVKPDEDPAQRAESPAPKKFKPLVWKFF